MDFSKLPIVWILTTVFSAGAIVLQVRMQIAILLDKMKDFEADIQEKHADNRKAIDGISTDLRSCVAQISANAVQAAMVQTTLVIHSGEIDKLRTQWHDLLNEVNRMLGPIQLGMQRLQEAVARSEQTLDKLEQTVDRLERRDEDERGH